MKRGTLESPEGVNNIGVLNVSEDLNFLFDVFVEGGTFEDLLFIDAFDRI